MANPPSFRSYKEAEAHWSANRDKIIDIKKSNPEDQLSPLALALELSRLYLVTKDARFRDAVIAVMQCDDCKNYKSKQKSSPHTLYVISKRRENEALSLIGALQGEGLSLRLSIANCVADLRWPGNSFAAASKSLERLWRTAGPRDP